MCIKRMKICLLAGLFLGLLAFAGCGGKETDSAQTDTPAETKEVQTEEAADDTKSTEDAETAADTADAAEETEAAEVVDDAENTEDTASETADEETGTVEQTGRCVAIDAGHQAEGNSEQEPVGPGASETKAKVASGTQGVSTGTPEYVLTLAVAQKLEAELISRGYEVFMIRESSDVNISNMERAEMANESGADIFVRIHADGADSSSVSGASTLYPGSDNPYISSLSEASRVLSQTIVDALCAATGANNRGTIVRDDLTGTNWSTIPVTVVEMGFMTNPEEDELMETDAYRQKLAEGIADGIDAYFAQQ